MSSHEQSALNATEFASAVTAISSAFGDATRRDIFLMVHEAGEGVTAADVADAFGLHVNVARHHLDKLAAGGYVRVEVARPKGRGAGRPSKRYGATAAALTTPLPIRHDALLVNLLKRALALLPPEQATAVATEVGVDYGRALAAQMSDVNESQRSLRAALHMVADAMTAHGFDAHVQDSDDELAIVAGHCPFGGRDVVHPVICAVDRGMVKGLLEVLYGESSPEHRSSLLAGAEVCTTEVGLSEPARRTRAAQ